MVRRLCRVVVVASLTAVGLVPLAVPPASAAGTVSLTALGTAYTQDFDTLATSGTTNSALPLGWDLSESGGGARDNEQYAAGDGSSNTGDTYSFGSGLSTERALGGLQSGTLIPVIGASFTNNTGSLVTALEVAYAGEEWRLGATGRGADRLDFQYSLDATSLTTGTWTNADALDFATPDLAGVASQRDGNDATNRSAIAATITGLSVAPDGTFWIRWTDFNASSADDGLAVDEFSLTPRFVEGAPFVCGDPATLIHDIQGTGTATPIPGVRTVEGVVVGDYQAAGQFGGYYLQEEDSEVDADPATSEGIFVFNTSTPVAVGDRVRVRGTAGEFSTLTQLSSLTATVVCSQGNTVTSSSVVLPVAGVADWERYEGMSVSIDQELTVTEVFTLARFGEAALSVGGRLANPTNVVAPGAPAQALQALNDRSRILLDDANNQQNIDPTFYPQGGLSASNTLRVGDTTPSLTGVLDQRFGSYRVQPVDPADVVFVHSNPRPASPDPVGGDVRVLGFNVLNYFNGDGAGGGFPTERGAESMVEFDRQRAKIIAAIDELDADVVGLMELENDDTDSQFGAIEDLVAGLNAEAGPGTYDFVDTGVVGGDAIRVGIIYQPARVTPVGVHAVLDSSVDPRFIDTKNRPSIAQTFERDGDRFTVVVNHLKSKGSGCDDVGDPDIGDGQGNCNLTRKHAAEALVDWVATDPTGSGDPDTLLIGDMNAYAMEDPITVFRNAGFTNTIASFLGVDAYSFVFQGQSGYLDHALASPSLAGQVTGVTEWHTNADEPVALDYNTNFKSPDQVAGFYAPDAYRASDHDPVLVGLDTNDAPTVGAGGPYAVVEGGSVTVTATGSDADGDTLTYAWDLDDNGTFETPGQSATFSAAGLEAPDTRTIRVQVSDGSATGTDTATVNVIWDFSGFFAPVDNPPTVNNAKAGSSVPLRFSLGGDQGLDVLAADSPVSTAYSCEAGTPSDVLEETASPGSQGLTYDAETDTYTYVWKTSKAWFGCRRLIVTLTDGTVHEALFQFK